MHQARRILSAVIGLACAQPAWAAQGEGLTADPERLSWTRWQGRISLGGALPLLRAGLGQGDAAGLRVDSIRLMGDYFLSRSLVGHGSHTGFRTTGGVIYGPRSQLISSQPVLLGQGAGWSVERHQLAPAEAADGLSDTATLPYLGIGYTGMSIKGGWRFNADLGMMALSPGNSVKLGKVVSGTQSLDDLLREMRLSPVLQLGVSYSF